MRSLRIFITAVLILITLKGMGQSDFRPGYYIGNDQDTVYGLLDYRGDLYNSQKCVFKPGNNSEEITFMPGEISSYRFERGKYYVSKQVETEEGMKRVFAEFLVDGITDLFYYRDEHRDENYFLETEEGEIKPLRNEKSILEEDDKLYQWNSNEHIQTLKSTFADCLEIQPKLDNAKLTHASLISLTSEYHDLVCNDGMCVVFQKEIPLLQVKTGVILGIGSSGLNFAEHARYEDYIFSRSMDPYIGIQINLTSPRINDKISVIFRSEWIKSYYHSYFEEAYSATSTYYYDFHARQNALKIMLGLQYTYPKGRFRPTLALGPLANYNVTSDFRYILERVSTDMVNTQEFIDNPLKDITFGGFVQLGTNIMVTSKQFIHTGVRYHYTSESVSEKIVLNSFSLFMGYFL